MKTTIIVEDGGQGIVAAGDEAAAGADESAASGGAPVDAGAAPVDSTAQLDAPSPRASSDGGPPPAWLLAAIAQAGGLGERVATGGDDVDAGAGPVQFD